MANIPLDDLQIDIVVNSDKASTAILAVADALKKTSASSKKLKAVTDAVRDMGKASEQAATQTEELSEKSGGDALKRITNYAKSAAKGLKSVASGMASAFSGHVSHTISNISEKIHTLFSSLKRIAFYRLIRSAIKGITTAIKEGVNALIEWDRTYGNNTSYAARTADEIAAKWGEVKKSFGAAAMPLIQMVQPALMSVMDTAIMVANTINQIFRSLQGYSTYMKATTQKIGESANKVKGAAKELKRVLFGFDELNVLPSDNGRGGGGADSNAGELDFVETDIDKRFSGKLSDIINNLVDSFEPVAVAKTIAEKLNKAISSVNGFLKDVNFLKIGQKIGTFLTTAISSIDWEGLGQIVVRWVTTIPTIIIGAIQTINLGSVGKAVFEFLKGALDTAIQWIKDIDWAATMYNLFSQLGSLIINLNPIELVKKVLKFAVNVIKAVISGVAGAFVGLLKSTFDLAGNVIEWIEGGVHTVVDWVKENVLKPVGRFFDAIGQSAAYVIDYIFHPSKWGTDFASGLKEIWDDAFGATQTSLDQHPLEFRTIVDPITGEVSYILTSGQNALDNHPLQLSISANLAKTGNLIARTINGWQSLIDKGSGLILPITPETSGMAKKYDRTPYWLPTFASGGITPESVGTLFVAGESGAEVVANMGNRTGVMNVGQMEQAVANGNVEVINAIYGMANMVVNAVNSKNFDVYMDASKVGRSVSNYQNNQSRRGIAQGAY